MDETVVTMYLTDGMNIYEYLSYLREDLRGQRRNNAGYDRRSTCEWTISALHSIIAIVTRGRGWCSLISLLRTLHNNILTTFGPLWRISDVIISCQAEEFVSAQVGVQIRRSTGLDQGDLIESVWC